MVFALNQDQNSLKLKRDIIEKSSKVKFIIMLHFFSWYNHEQYHGIL